MSIFNESLRRPEVELERRWWPRDGIVVIDVRDNFLDPSDLARLIELNENTGFVLVGNEAGEWNPRRRVQTIALNGQTLESLVAQIEPEVVVTSGYKENNIKKNNSPRVKIVDPLKTGDYTVEHIDRGINNSTKQQIGEQDRRSVKERWIGSKKKGGKPGVRDLVKRSKQQIDEDKPHWMRSFLAEYDVGLAEIGLIGGVIASLDGVSANVANLLTAGLVAAPAIEYGLYKTKEKIGSPKWREVWEIGQKVIGSLFALGAGFRAGMMIGAMIGVGVEIGAEVGTSFGKEVEVQEFMHAQSHVMADVNKQERGHEPVIDPLPPMDWAHLPDYFHNMLNGNDWINPENGVSLSQVQTDYVLKHHGNMPEVQVVLDKMSRTGSFDDYMKMRNAGQIYP